MQRSDRSEHHVHYDFAENGIMGLWALFWVNFSLHIHSDYSMSLWVYDIESASSTSCPDKCWLKPCAVRTKKNHGTGAKWSVRCPSQHSGFGVRFTVGNCRCFHNLFQNVEFVDFEKIGCIMQSTSQWSTQQLKIIDFDVVPVFNTPYSGFKVFLHNHGGKISQDSQTCHARCPHLCV